VSEFVNDLQKIALLAVLQPDDDAFIRRIYRWFSTTFHVPLPDVDDLPLDYVLLHYFEANFEQLDDDQKHNKIISLLETVEEKRQRELEEKADDEAFLKMAEAEVKGLQEGRDTPDIKALKGTSLRYQKKGNTEVAIDDSVLEEQKKALNELPEIKLNYIDENLMDQLGETDFTAPKKQS